MGLSDKKNKRNEHMQPRPQGLSSDPGNEVVNTLKVMSASGGQAAKYEILLTWSFRDQMV